MPLVESFSGIRGIYNDELDKDVVKKYAIAYMKYLTRRYINPKIVIGHDTRDSWNELLNAIFEVFDDAIYLGIATTPMIELAVREYKRDGGIINTASHNEPEWNGLKFLDNDGAILSLKEMDEVIKNYKNHSEISGMKKVDGNAIVNRHTEILDNYTCFVEKILGKKPLKEIVSSEIRFLMDPNGGAGILAIHILNKLGIKFDAINTQIGMFHRIIEPNESSLKVLQVLVKKTFELGFAFDCDADRVELVTKKGIVLGDYLLALCVDEALSNSNNPKKEYVVVNDATSGIVRWITKEHNARYLESEVGEANVVEKMDQYKSIIGGEGSSSGVIIFPSKCRDGILTMLYVLAIVSKRKKSIEEILGKYPRFFTLRNDLVIPPDSEDNLKEYLAKYYSEKGFKVKKLASIKVFIDANTFLWFRVSKTESNKLRIMADSMDKAKAEDLLSNAYTIVDKYAKGLNNVKEGLK
ncbi:MAG: hypothetical protein AABY14_00875 [Nanoarchaeota archaeon]